MESNFTLSDEWNSSLLIRYSLDHLKEIDNIYFYSIDNQLKCQHFFEFELSDLVLKKLCLEIKNNNSIKFSYIHESKLTYKLKQWSKENNFKCELIDTWEAPQLILKDSVKNYLETSSHSQIRRNYNLYNKNKSKYKFYNSNHNDALNLWSLVLEIDFNSWKKEENSDMKSLDREDLQYLPFLLKNKKDSNLVVVCDYNDKPLAYSLMFKNGDGYWYAVKWGASYEGRKLYTGFFCLFNHLEYLFDLEGMLLLDFWGRRNNTYDKLKNNYVMRSHILISKE